MSEVAAQPKIQPYYQKDGITIYCADCMDVLPQIDGVDLVVTDPPYGMSFVSGHRAVQYRPIHGDDRLDVDAINEIVCRASRAAYVFCRWDNLPDMPKPKSVLAWIKNSHSMGDLKHEHGRQWEACCFYPGEMHEFKRRIGDVLRADRTGKMHHPTEKPVNLIEQIISCNVCDSVLDPYMGSGTTLVAAKLCGKRAVGIEIDEKYCEVAVKRLSQGVLF